jgi:hypothetical protein
MQVNGVGYESHIYSAGILYLCHKLSRVERISVSYVLCCFNKKLYTSCADMKMRSQRRIKYIKSNRWKSLTQYIERRASWQENSLLPCHEYPGILWAPNFVQMGRDTLYSGRNLRIFRRSLLPLTSQQKNVTKTKAAHSSETSVISQYHPIEFCKFISRCYTPFLYDNINMFFPHIFQIEKQKVWTQS